MEEENFIEQFRERPVYGWVRDGDGSPMPNAKVYFKPSGKLGLTATDFVIDKQFYVLTNDNGFYFATLWCDEDSLVAINWQFAIITDIAEPVFTDDYEFSLAYDDGSPIAVSFLATNGVAVPSPVELLYQSLDVRIAQTSVRFDIAQTLTPQEQKRARQNLGVKPESMIFAASDLISDLTTGTDKMIIPIPYDLVLTDVRAHFTVEPPSGADFIIDLNINDTSILEEKLIVEDGAHSSVTAANQPVISNTNLVENSILSVDFDQIGAAGTGKGIIITLIYTRD